jgi:hypothetical protein
MTVSNSRAVRVVFRALGFLSVGVAFIGIAVPLIPTVGPVLLAAFFFSKSSERFDRWLADNRYFGTIVQDWRAGRGFTVRAKVTAIAAIALTFTISAVFVLGHVAVRVGFITFAAGLAIYIWQLPTKHTVTEPL